MPIGMYGQQYMDLQGPEIRKAQLTGTCRVGGTLQCSDTPTRSRRRALLMRGRIQH